VTAGAGRPSAVLLAGPLIELLRRSNIAIAHWRNQMKMLEQPKVVENPFWVRMDRRVNTFHAATSKRRGVATLRLIDFAKEPLDPEQSRRYAVYGDLLACFLILQEWDPAVVAFGMGEGKHPVTNLDPAVDASAQVESRLNTGARVKTTCIEELPTSRNGKQRLAAREREAEESGCLHRVFTYNDGIANRIKLENAVFLNPMLHRVPGERFDCRYELRVIHDALDVRYATTDDRKTTTLGYLQAAGGVSIARMQGTVARLLHSGDLETVNGLHREAFSLISELRWVNRSTAPVFS
jgi:hypothetical protein